MNGRVTEESVIWYMVRSTRYQLMECRLRFADGAPAARTSTWLNREHNCLEESDIVQRNVEQYFFKNLFTTTWDVLRQSSLVLWLNRVDFGVSLITYFTVHKIAPLVMAADICMTCSARFWQE